MAALTHQHAHAEKALEWLARAHVISGSTWRNVLVCGLTYKARRRPLDLSAAKLAEVRAEHPQRRNRAKKLAGRARHNNGLA